MNSEKMWKKLGWNYERSECSCAGYDIKVTKPIDFHNEMSITIDMGISTNYEDTIPERIEFDDIRILNESEIACLYQTLKEGSAIEEMISSLDKKKLSFDESLNEWARKKLKQRLNNSEQEYENPLDELKAWLNNYQENSSKSLDSYDTGISDCLNDVIKKVLEIEQKYNIGDHNE